MESCYALALKELENIRLENRQKTEERYKEVTAKVPEILSIDSELMKNGTNLLKCVLNKCSNFEQIKENIQTLQKKKHQLLEKNGYKKDYLDDIYTCSVCNDSGFDDTGKRCACHKNLILKYMGKNSNLTPLMKEQTFENFDLSIFKGQSKNVPGDVLKIMAKVCDKAIDFAENFDKTHESLIIQGSAGTGKTFIASCIANRALERGKSVYYNSAYKLFEMFENAKFHGSEDDDYAIKYVYDADLLIIDDIGTEFITQYTAATFFDIISSRLNSKKSTIITTNLGFDNLDELYSSRVTSRITGDYTVLITLGEDLRRKTK